MRVHTVRHCGLALVLLALWAAFAETAWGQSTTPAMVLRTGQGIPINTFVQPLGSLDGVNAIQFAFGFSTDEEPAPGVFFDSFTLSLAEVQGSLTAILNTTDRAGAFWAPGGDGTIIVSPDSINRQPIPFPLLSPNHLHQFAFFVTVPIPAELAGKNLNFYADLFDNGNAVHSLGWISSVTPVPEPSAWLIGLTGILFVFGFKWRNR